MNYNKRISDVFNSEGNELVRQSKSADFGAISTLIDLIDQCKGTIFLTGCGTSAMAARKATHTLNVIGISATYLNPSDAVHGQLGTIKQKDIVIFISKGGNTAELVSFLPNVEEKESKMVLITENQESKIGKVADLVVPVKVLKEADTFNMLATTSTLAVISLFDAVAVVLMTNDHFSKNEFLENHPSGDVGDRLREGKD